MIEALRTSDRGRSALRIALPPRSQCNALLCPNPRWPCPATPPL